MGETKIRARIEVRKQNEKRTKMRKQNQCENENKN